MGAKVVEKLPGPVRKEYIDLIKQRIGNKEDEKDEKENHRGNLGKFRFSFICFCSHLSLSTSLFL